MWQIWLIFAGIFLIVEIMTVGFLIFWLAIGALLAMIVSFFTDSIIIQTSVFVISSTILIFSTKPFVKKFAHNKDSVKTNVYSIIGKSGVVCNDIDPVTSKGQVKVDGELWSASTIDNVSIPKNTKIKVVEVEGVKLIVTPINVTSNENV